jgi:hypothetical protein
MPIRCSGAGGHLRGVTSPYTIKNGRVVTTLAQEPYAVTVYKRGTTCSGARRREFGYANYELLPKPPAFIHPLNTGEPAQPGAAD